MEIAKAVLVIVAVSMATWGGARGQTTSLTCAATLVPCASYLNSTATPPDSCCSPLRTAVKDQLTCLCKVLDDKALLQAYSVTTEETLRIATSCGITQLSLCSSPTSQPSPPGSSGKNAANRVKWIGMSGLMSVFLVWCSIMVA